MNTYGFYLFPWGFVMKTCSVHLNPICGYKNVSTSAGAVNHTDTVPVDFFTVPLHSPNGRQLPAVRAVQRDCHWHLKNYGNPHRLHEPIITQNAVELMCLPIYI